MTQLDVRVRRRRPPGTTSLHGGQRFGRLVLGEWRHVPERKRWLWLCTCDCGGSVECVDYELASGHTQSCGCLHRETASALSRRHGQSVNGKSPTYQSWQHMIRRCHSESDDNYQRYGGRGIAVCDRWRNSFENFLADMGERPAGHTLDRRDGTKGYSPDNCRWATPIQQGQNTSRAKLTAEKAGEIRALKGCGISGREVARRFSISHHRVRAIWNGEAWRVE